MELFIETFRSHGASLRILRVAGCYKYSAPTGQSELEESRKEP
jgi:hypothetical protein